MMNPDKKLGDKIRELRKQRGITQKDLAGDRITRNMLSLIESGSASPSVSTLLYIAERLETPVGYFFTSSPDEEGRFLKISVIVPLKEQFRLKNYRECEQICAELPSYAIDDELAYILALSYLHTASEHAYAFDFRTACADLDKAERFSSSSIYCGTEFSRALLFYRDLIRSCCTDNLPDSLYDLSICGEYVPYHMVQYFIALKQLKAGESIPLSLPRNTYPDKHITALSSAMDDHPTEGLKKLRDLSLDPSLPYYMQYRVLSDLEECANTVGDVRLAYSSSRRKLELIEKFRIL
ncbi:MAG: helix-turn-helix transcriptional regulator [Clostridia bacterium]|nr:helix-turn-helix transcriptional regulator [Clostridia bacterium]